MIVKKKKFYQTHLLHGSADNYALLFLSLVPLSGVEACSYSVS